MLILDKEIDKRPSQRKVRDLAELRIRNLQAFRELESFNNTGNFLNKHPLVVHYSTRIQLEELLKHNPDTFLEEYANTRENVKRYKSFLNNEKRSDEQKVKDKINLKKHMDRETLMKDILSEKHE